MIRAEEVHEHGVDAALPQDPAGADRYYITFDADGLDAAIAPGVLDPGFGGLTYYEASNLLRGIARQGQIVGYDIVEVVPSARRARPDQPLRRPPDPQPDGRDRASRARLAIGDWRLAIGDWRVVHL